MIILKSPMTIVMLLIFAVMLFFAARWPEEARFMPFVIGIPALLLCALQLALDIRNGPSRADAQHSIGEELRAAEARVSQMTGREMHFEVAHDADLPEEEKVSEEAAASRETITWLAFTGLLVSIVLFGFHLSVPVFLVAFLYWVAKLPASRAILYALIATAFMMLVFEKVLQSELHRGIVTEYISALIAG
jgi:uncharacterized integral membrane protein